MEQVHPDGKVVAIEGNVAHIEYASGGQGFLSLDKMPKGVKVGDRVVVTLEIILKNVKLAE